MNNKVNVWMFPKTSTTNRYNELFSNCVEGEEFEVIDFQFKNILDIKNNDILHFHWLHPFYSSRVKVVFVIKALILLLSIKFLKMKNVKLVWTLHNLYPHKCKFKTLEKIVRKKVLKTCDLVMVAAESIRKEVSKEFSVPENKLFVVRHGHYNGAYHGKGINYRKEKGIPDDVTVLLFIGAIKEYKGVEGLIKSYYKMAPNKTHLIIAGKVYDDLEPNLKPYFNEKNITFDLRFIPDEEVVDIVNASNVIVLPYNNITTSGSAILASSLYKPLISPSTPFMREYFNSELAYLYNRHDPEGLYKAVETAIFEIQSKQNRKSAYDDFIEFLSWEKIGGDVRGLYRQII